MKAENYLQSGDLENALAALTEQVRKNPAKVELRIFLFQLLSVLGQWDRAMTQLNVAAEMDSDAALMAMVYRPALNCEALRASVFQGQRTPLIFGEPLEWMVWLTQVPGLIAAGQLEDAAALLGRPYSVAARVVEGDRVGRQLGFPTANLDVSELVLPPYGVYAAEALVAGRAHPAVLNLGVRPTLDRPEPTPRLEAHLLDMLCKIFDPLMAGYF